MREFELLEHVYRANERLDARVLVPPGDDMALVAIEGGGRVLAAVDQLVAGRHVDLAVTPLALVGRKAITRCLSDVAAMAARPTAALVAVTLPPDFGAPASTELFDAMRETAEQYDCPLVGGDIAVHGPSDHPLTCAVTVLAEPAGERVVTRGGAKAGDDVYVTGTLGGAVAPDGGGRHLTFEPRIAEALELLEHLGPRLHAMIDLSDGLGRDADHVADASGVQLRIDAERIPRTSGCDWRSAAGTGEDYELLFTATGEVPDALAARTSVTRIGAVAQTSAGPRVVIMDGEEAVDATALGWEHQP
jgi:thiamine-monophosphate kinase